MEHDAEYQAEYALDFRKKLKAERAEKHKGYSVAEINRILTPTTW